MNPERQQWLLRSKEIGTDLPHAQVRFQRPSDLWAASMAGLLWSLSSLVLNETQR